MDVGHDGGEAVAEVWLMHFFARALLVLMLIAPAESAHCAPRFNLPVEKLDADATPSDSAGLLRFALGEEPQPQ
jgi:hypothetical protein